MEISDERRRDAGVEQTPLDLGHSFGGFWHVDGDPNHFRAGFDEFDALLRRRRASAVSVIVIDCTTTSAPPPTDGADLDADRPVEFHLCMEQLRS